MDGQTVGNILVRTRLTKDGKFEWVHFRISEIAHGGSFNTHIQAMGRGKSEARTAQKGSLYSRSTRK